MYPLVETMLIMNGLPANPAYHSERFNRSRYDLFGVNEDVNLGDIIEVPPGFKEGRAKCRLIYGRDIHEVLFYEYTPAVIESFKIVTDDNIDYSYKYTDRSAIDRLLGMRGDCDDILILKDGLITDASSSNVVFFNGYEWHTPAAPLLRGTCRARLIDEGRIIEKNISPVDIVGYEFCSPFNALREPGEIKVPVSRIVS